jgi:hypothetical protein
MLESVAYQWPAFSGRKPDFDKQRRTRWKLGLPSHVWGSGAATIRIIPGCIAATPSLRINSPETGSLIDS